ncbi:MAG: TetR/AcrR family transcriptional regulator [Coriobacteriales bacterium]|jgi:AcrR family transcriptional regulator|nr:TetR/AcrR family transcriptional regulator [Coriobacteriales bacterium]
MSDALIVQEALVETATADRRILRSRRMLREAFAALIEARGLDGFTVSELTERADLNRGTFYAHYKDKEDLLRSFEDEIIEGLLDFEEKLKGISLKEFLLLAARGTPPRVAVELFDTLREHGTLLRVLLGPRGDAAFQARLRDTACTNFVRAVLHKKYRDNPSALTDYYIAYHASANLGLIQAWLERGMREDSQEMAHIMLAVLFLKPGDPIVLKKKG